MARRNNHELAFAALSIEGALLAPDFLNKVAHLDAPEQAESDYDIPRGLKLRDEIGRYWKIAQNLWQDFSAKRERTDLDSHALTVRDFLEPFCRQVLGFGDLRAVGQLTVDERIFPIGFSAGEGKVPLVFAAHDQGLDKPSARHGDGVRRRSPFLLAQEYLNANEAALWAVVSNGLKLRVLRDNPSLTRPAYIEADLEAIFNEGLYPDFTALWLLAHATRFGKAGAEPTECALERWRNTAQEDGIRARDRLRVGVTEALRALGTGFLAHKDNGELRRRIQAGELNTQAYFEQLLRLIYRFIFLATIEDRDLVFAPNAAADARQRYLAGYSLTRLRQLAARRRSYDRHADLWQALTITFAGLGQGQPALGLPALGGLFAGSQCPDIDPSELDNSALLSALFSLCFFRDGAALSRVNYRDMDSEELGSVYESLLELVPQVALASNFCKFGFIGDDEEGSTKGNARKLTGSYYTPDSLVQELIKSALEPVIERTLAEHPQEPVKALLALSVCDPACGSGHFLLAAARRIAEEVARLNATDGNPLPADYRRALRDVVAHCIYGVDKNPMAVELARTALWLEAYTPERPLTFLDAHLRCGDALLGILDPAVLDTGIPDKAFNALSGDDKEVVKRIKKANRDALKAIEKAKAPCGQFSLSLQAEQDADTFEHLPDDTLEAVEVKRAAFAALQARLADSRARLAADLFVAAFVLPKSPDNEAQVPTSQDLWLVQNGSAPRPGVAEAARRAANNAQAFHWWQAFPHVRAKGGFDVLLGNPPWEVSQMGEEEYFAARAPSIAAMAGDKRKRAIAALETENPHLWRKYQADCQRVEAVNTFFRESERFPLTAIGKLNTYPLFAETFAQLVGARGRAGFIVPSGIGTDDSTKCYFQFLVAERMLSSFYGFDNARRIFPAVHPDTPFALVTVGKTDQLAELGHYLLSVDHLDDPRRRFTLSPQDFALINPNTLTCPIFRSERDAELTKKIYRAAPVLIAEGPPERNPWSIKFSQGLFNMTSDSHLFQDSPAPGRLPLYEAKMIHLFDHRWASYGADGSSGDVLHEQKQNPAFAVTPRYWVDERVVLLKISRLPKLLLDQLRTENQELVVLSMAIILFAHWLRARYEDRYEECARHLYPEWQSFVAAQPFAREIDPTQTGLGGDNPTSYKPLDSSYLPCAPIDKIVATERERTGWIAADPVRLNSFLRGFPELVSIVDLSAPVATAEEALGLAEAWLVESCPKWLMGWRDITNATNERTVIASVVPRVGVGNQMPLMLFDDREDRRVFAALLGNLSALAFDFVARHKVGGTHLNYFIYKQLPVIPPDRYTGTDLAFITPRVVELTYTAHDLAHWAADLGYTGEPFAWNPERRAQLRAELDAYYARLYGLSRDELRYILDPADVMGEDYPSETFRVLKNSELREFGEYRTRRLVLEAWDAMETDWNARVTV